jgi:hypothetical protein
MFVKWIATFPAGALREFVEYLSCPWVLAERLSWWAVLEGVVDGVVAAVVAALSEAAGGVVLGDFEELPQPATTSAPPAASIGTSHLRRPIGAVEVGCLIWCSSSWSACHLLGRLRVPGLPVGRARRSALP